MKRWSVIAFAAWLTIQQPTYASPEDSRDYLTRLEQFLCRNLKLNPVLQGSNPKIIFSISSNGQIQHVQTEAGASQDPLTTSLTASLRDLRGAPTPPVKYSSVVLGMYFVNQQPRLSFHYGSLHGSFANRRASEPATSSASFAVKTISGEYGEYGRILQELCANAWKSSVGDDLFSCQACITLDQDGVLKEARVASSSNDESYDQKVLSTIRAIRFPAPPLEGQREIEIPLEFSRSALRKAPLGWREPSTLVDAFEMPNGKPFGFRNITLGSSRETVAGVLKTSALELRCSDIQDGVLQRLQIESAREWGPTCISCMAYTDADFQAIEIADLPTSPVYSFVNTNNMDVLVSVSLLLDWTPNNFDKIVSLISERYGQAERYLPRTKPTMAGIIYFWENSASIITLGALADSKMRLQFRLKSRKDQPLPAELPTTTTTTGGSQGMKKPGI